MSKSSNVGSFTYKAARVAAQAGAVAAVSASVAFAADYEMIISHPYPEDPMSNEVQPSLLHFEALVESATGGAIDVQVFAGGQLGNEVESGKQTQAGRTMQGAVMSSGAMSSFFSDYQIITSPFLFNDYLTARAYFDGDWHADFMKGAIEQSGLRYLGTFDDGGGFVALTTNKRLVRTVEDLEGLKIRVEENPAHVAIMKALGASATPLPWGEVHTALSTGLADGQFNAPGISTAYKLYDVTDYTTLSGHVYNSTTFVISEEWYQTLPQEYREAIAIAAREAVKIGHGIAALQAVNGWTESCKLFEECYVLPEAERVKMAEIARPAWREWVTGDFGVDPALVEGLWAEVARISAVEKTTSIDLYAD